MASYYYLIASLPMLKLDDLPPLSSEEFLATCQQTLSNKDFMLVQSFVDGTVSSSQSKHPYVVSWNKFLQQVLSTLHAARIEKLGLPAAQEQDVFASDLKVQDVIREVMQAPNPLEAELILIRLYWEKATELAKLKIFTIEVVCTYAIHLGLLERKALFTPLEGNAEFKRLFSNLQSIIKSI